MKKPIRVLVVEDSEFDARILIGVLRQGGYDPAWERVETPEQMEAALLEKEWDVILSDYNLPDFSAPDALMLLQESARDLPFIIISGGIGEDVAVAAMKAGAHDYLMKGNLARLIPAVEREMRDAEARRGRRLAEEALRDSEQQYRLLWENSTDAVLLMQEDGVVKFANPAVTEVFGHNPIDLVGTSFQSLLDPRFRAGFKGWAEAHLSKLNRAKRKAPVETLGLRKGGGEVHLEIAFNQVELKGEAYLVAFIRDISERKRAEEESLLLQSITLVAGAAQDQETALRLVLQAICEATGWGLGQAWLPKADGLQLECSPAYFCQSDRLAPFRRESLRNEYDPMKGLPGRVWLGRKPIWIPDITTAPTAPRSAIARQVGVSAAVGIPVMAEQEIIAVIEFFVLERKDEDERMIKLFSALAVQLGNAIQRKATLQELQANAEQFRVAREIQERLFPAGAPDLYGFDIAGRSQPASAAGGDYFDFLRMQSGGLGIVVGDVTGHGIGPALLMAETRAYLRVLAHNNEDVGAILTHANRCLAGDIDCERFITMLLIRLMPGQLCLTYANAGHPPAYILDRNGARKHVLSRTGVPLGVRPERDYPEAASVPLDSGDLVLLLTDGVDEAIAPDESMFGIDRALDVVRAHRANSASAIVEALFAEVRAFAQDASQLDDTTVVVIKVR